MTGRTDHGKIVIFARGARNASSKFASAQAFTYAEYVIFAGNGFLSLNQINPILYFADLSADYTKYCYACFFLEICDKLLLPEMHTSDALQILLRSLNALNTDKLPANLVLAVFIFKFLQKEGIAPLSRSCPVCCDATKPVFAADGVVCPACNPNAEGIPITKGVFQALCYILESRIEKMLSFRAADNVVDDLFRCATYFLRTNVDVKIKSLEFKDNT